MLILAVVGVIIVLILLLRWAIRKTEHFSQPLYGVPVNPESRYPKAYYTEMENEDFEVGMRSTFHLPCGLKTRVMDPNPPWAAVGKDDAGVRQEYAATLAWIVARVNAAPCFALPDGSQPPFQIVAEELKEAQRRGADYLLAFDVVLYRYPKFNGKHVTFVVYIDHNAKTRYAVALDTVGVVAEDLIGMYPVDATDPMAEPNVPIEGGTYPTFLLDNATVIRILKEQNEKLGKWAQSKIIRMGQNPSPSATPSPS